MSKMSDFFFSEDITYCMDGECLRTECIRHRSRAPIGVPLSWANMKYQEGCLLEKIKAPASAKDIDVPNTDMSDYSDRLWRAEYERGKQIGLLQGIEDTPTRPTARWVDTEPDVPDAHYRKNGMAYYCSNCHHRAGKYKHRTYKYCPWCGARMDEGEG